MGLIPNFLNSVNTRLAAEERSLVLCMAIALPRTFSNAASIVASRACYSACFKSLKRVYASEKTEVALCSKSQLSADMLPGEAAPM